MAFDLDTGADRLRYISFAMRVDCTGTVCIIHYDTLHRAMASKLDQTRHMLKFIVCRCATNLNISLQFLVFLLVCLSVVVACLDPGIT
jgi:hypothetical protein